MAMLHTTSDLGAMRPARDAIRYLGHLPGEAVFRKDREKQEQNKYHD